MAKHLSLGDRNLIAQHLNEGCSFKAIAKELGKIFEKLYLELRPDIFTTLMPILLADNGSKFSNPRALELNRQGNLRTHVFYCDASAPYQKGSAERNHEFIRKLVLTTNFPCKTMYRENSPIKTLYWGGFYYEKISYKSQLLFITVLFFQHSYVQHIQAFRQITFPIFPVRIVLETENR